MKPKTIEQKRVASLMAKSRPIGKRAMKRIETGYIGADNVKMAYLCQWERVEEYQVFRYFEVRRNRKTRRVTSVEEVFRNYLNCENLKQTIVAKQLNGMASVFSAYPVFCRDTALEIRVRRDYTSYGAVRYSAHFQDSGCYDTYVKSVHPLMTKRGVTPDAVERCGSHSLLTRLFHGSDSERIETALKWEDTALVEVLMDGIFHGVGEDDFWRALLIAKRGGFDFSKVGYDDYIDYLAELKRLSLDLRSPKYLCPSDFTAEHERLTEILRKKDERAMRQRERERRERERIKAEQDLASAGEKDEEYIRTHAPYLAIVIKAEGLTIAPLQSVTAFAEEGQAMHHCVFSCAYYKKADTLILSARDESGERVETVEFNLKTLKVVQSRGVHNQATEWHERIVSEVERQMPQALRKAQAA